ncbi:MAG: HK97 family phage prohead protease [Bacteroidota bacterium]
MNQEERRTSKETRTVRMELRAAEDPNSRTIEGYAAIYGSESVELWGFNEIIEPGAFDEADLSDVRALFNHDPNQILARSKSGTLELVLDEKGLKYRFDAPESPVGDHVLTMVRRGDISESSFCFVIVEDSWEDRGDELPLRHLRKIGVVHDIAPVTYPAYEKTSATARSLEKFTQSTDCHVDDGLLAALDILELQ